MGGGEGGSLCWTKAEAGKPAKRYFGKASTRGWRLPQVLVAELVRTSYFHYFGTTGVAVVWVQGLNEKTALPNTPVSILAWLHGIFC